MKKNWKLIIGLCIVSLLVVGVLCRGCSVGHISEKEAIQTTAAPLLKQLINEEGQGYLTVKTVGEISYVKIQGNNYLGSVKMIVDVPLMGGECEKLVNFNMVYDGKTIFVQLAE